MKFTAVALLIASTSALRLSSMAEDGIIGRYCSDCGVTDCPDPDTSNCDLSAIDCSGVASPGFPTVTLAPNACDLTNPFDPPTGGDPALLEGDAAARSGSQYQRIKAIPDELTVDTEVVNADGKKKSACDNKRKAIRKRAYHVCGGIKINESNYGCSEEITNAMESEYGTTDFDSVSATEDAATEGLDNPCYASDWPGVTDYNCTCDPCGVA